MCTWGTEKRLRVPIPANCSYTHKFRWDQKPIDACVAPLVDALNIAGLYTGGSCCGHGKASGYISLHDGTVLTIMKVPPETMSCAATIKTDAQEAYECECGDLTPLSAPPSP